MSGIESRPQAMEIIDNEKQINGKLDTFESGMKMNLENKEALLILNKIEPILKKEYNAKDIDLAFDKLNNTYHLIIDGQVEGEEMLIDDLKNILNDRNIGNFKKTVLSNPDFADGDIPEELQIQEENIDRIYELINMKKNDFFKNIHQMNQLELIDSYNLLKENLINSDNSENITELDKSKNIRKIKHMMEDIKNLLTTQIGINEDNLPINENGTTISTSEMWPEGIPKELNN